MEISYTIGKCDAYYVKLSEAELAETLECITGITSLDLSGNELTSLPPEILNLQDLTELNLNANRFTAFPPEIFQLKSLKKIHLVGNDITSFPLGVKGQLSYIDARCNPLDGDAKKMLYRLGYQEEV